MSDVSLPKEDFLGHLDSKTESELKELLKRQERLYSNITFIKKLPDKGKKIERLIERLKSILAQRERVNETADLFQKMAIHADEYRRERERIATNDEDEEENPDPLKQLINKEMNMTKIKDERMDEGGDTVAAPMKFTNSYDVVLRREKEKDPTSKQPFFPHRTVRSKDITEVPSETLVRLKTEGGSPLKETEMDMINTDSRPGHDRLAPPEQSQINDTKHTSSETVRDPSICVSEGAAGVVSRPPGRMSAVSMSRPGDSSRRLKHHYDESLESEMFSGPKCHESTKIISIDESVKMLDINRKKMQELQAQQASERLVQRLHITTAPFDPEGSRIMSYRAAQAEIDEEEDEEEGEEDDSEKEGEDYLD